MGLLIEPDLLFSANGKPKLNKLTTKSKARKRNFPTRKTFKGRTPSTEQYVEAYYTLNRNTETIAFVGS
jgi:hypothetical protein